MELGRQITRGVLAMDRHRWVHEPLGLFTGVARAVGHSDQATFGVVIGSDEEILIMDLLLPLDQNHTLYLFQVVQRHPLHVRATCNSDHIQAGIINWSSFRHIKELCAGMGGMSFGCGAAGAVTDAVMDINHFACQHLERNLRCPVLQGDIRHDHDLHKLHRAGTTSPGLLTAGFPCQPWSSQGDRRTLEDERSLAFWGVLRAALLLQPAGLILECVAEVGYHLRVQEAIQDFANVMNWHYRHTILELQHTWPMRRTRWWACFIPKDMPAPALRPWPRDERHHRLAQIIHNWPVWAPQSELLLRFSEEELDKYFNAAYGKDSRLLDLHGACPTLLHSYAHPLTGCPCQCRNRGFGEWRLRQRGLRGFGVLTEPNAHPRHLHAREAGLLMTFPDSYHYKDGRDSLPMLGQAAAPLQCLWVYSHIMQAVDAHFDELTLPDPVEVVNGYKLELLAQQHDGWVWPSTLAPHDILVQTNDDSPYTVACSGLVNAQQFLTAEHFQLDWGYSMQLFDGPRRVLPDAILQETGRHGPYTIRKFRKRQAHDQPAGLIFISIQLPSTSIHTCLPAGSFLFEAVTGHDLPAGVPPRDSTGAPWDWTQRIWCSSNLTIGYGPQPPSEGLGISAHFMWFLVNELRFLFDKQSSHSALSMILIHNQHIELWGSCPSELSTTAWAFPLLCEGHWMLVHLQPRGSQLHVQLFDGLAPRELHDALRNFLRWIQVQFGATTMLIQWAQPLRQTRPTPAAPFSWHIC